MQGLIKLSLKNLQNKYLSGIDLFRGVVMFLNLEGPKYLKPFGALFVFKSGGAQPYFYFCLREKVEGPGPSRPRVRLRPCSCTTFF